MADQYAYDPIEHDNAMRSVEAIIKRTRAEMEHEQQKLRPAYWKIKSCERRIKMWQYVLACLEFGLPYS